MTEDPAVEKIDMKAFWEIAGKYSPQVRRRIRREIKAGAHPYDVLRPLMTEMDANFAGLSEGQRDIVLGKS